MTITPIQADELHRRLAPSEAAYNLIHTHCLVVEEITRQLVRNQNYLFMTKLEEDSASKATLTIPEEDSMETSEGRTGSGRETSLGHAGSSYNGVKGGRASARLLDEDLAVVGALLHDIGTYLVLASDGSDGGPLRFDGPNYVQHGLKGYEWLKSQGVDESVALFARNHTGVGLTREQVVSQHLPLPADDYSPTTLEQEVVMVADKYNSKSIPPRFLTVQAYTRKAARFGEENKRQWLTLVEQYGVPDIPALAAQFRMKLEE